MNNEHIGTCIYEKGRFELRETDNAIIDLKGDFPPIIIASNTVDDNSEPNCADRRSVLYLLNELADNNPNEERHWYLKKMLDKAWTQYHELKEKNEQLKKEKEYWKGDACSQSNYLSILSMDCRIVEEAILNLKNVIDVDTEAYNLLDELSDKFNELQEHRINWSYNSLEEEKQDVIKYLRDYND